ncbi:MAG: EutN/CcmL family microcompartment protein [Planctomycetes bacterium]|nr:EutN/CcmL family microcompartment protein [Planctomycetota bacterium]
MFLGRVIGTVWATRKDPRLEGLKLLVVRELDTELKPQQRFVIAVDVVQAGVGDVVLVSQGSAARQSPLVEGRPIDALIMAVVDDLQVCDPQELEASYAARRDPLVAQLEAQPES